MRKTVSTFIVLFALLFTASAEMATPFALPRDQTGFERDFTKIEKIFLKEVMKNLDKNEPALDDKEFARSLSGDLGKVIVYCTASVYNIDGKPGKPIHTYKFRSSGERLTGAKKVIGTNRQMMAETIPAEGIWGPTITDAYSSTVGKNSSGNIRVFYKNYTFNKPDGSQAKVCLGVGVKVDNGGKMD